VTIALLADDDEARGRLTADALTVQATCRCVRCADHLFLCIAPQHRVFCISCAAPSGARVSAADATAYRENLDDLVVAE